MPAFQYLLPLGAIAFYLYDSTLLLYGNEVLLTHWRGSWSTTRGSEMMWMGRRVCVPNPLLPAASTYRTRWRPRATREISGPVVEIAAVESALRPIRVLVNAMAILLLAVLPGVSWSSGAGWPLLVVFGIFYLLMFSALVFTYGRRMIFGIGNKRFWLLAVDVLTCAPFAVNLVRKITVGYAIGNDSLQFAHMHLDQVEQVRLRDLVAAEVREHLAREEPGSERSIELQSFLEQLEAK